jgi:hypothetical protein
MITWSCAHREARGFEAQHVLALDLAQSTDDSIWQEAARSGAR